MSIVITSAVRTPMGAFQGCFKDLSAHDLGAIAIKAAIDRAQVDPNAIEEVLMGCVLQAGQGQAPARQAAIKAGIPHATGAVTINKMCGSGMKALMFAHDEIQASTFNCIVAGGMESMTLAPYLLPKARAGYRLGHQRVFDHMFLDGLEDAYDQGQLMGVFAERCAEHYHFTREQQDQFAIESLTRAQQASRENKFEAEVVPVITKSRHEATEITLDETPQKAKLDKIPLLKPAFKKDGTVTAANSSSISDGAAALVVMHERFAQQHNLAPLAKIVGHATHAQEPAWFTTAPVAAIEKLLKKINWTVADVDLFEINEAFAVVTLAAIKELKLDPQKVNVHGGACALGHPIGASGARVVVTLIHALKQYGLKRGIASLCIGGGEATAVAIEII